jgi:hypothetical protein
VYLLAPVGAFPGGLQSRSLGDQALSLSIIQVPEQFLIDSYSSHFDRRTIGWIFAIGTPFRQFGFRFTPACTYTGTWTAIALGDLTG